MAGPGNVNILLVDDQPSKLMSYEVVLGSLGERLFKASSVREALDILLRHDIAVILADVCMPEIDGFELARMLREHPRYKSTAVIFISAVNLSDDDLARGYELGAVDYVPVPVIPAILRAKVRVFVDLHRKTHELEALNAELEKRVDARTLELQEVVGRLAESEERLRLASTAAGFGTYDYNIADDRMHCSQHLKRLLGTDIKGDISLATFLDLVHVEDRPAVERAMSGDGGFDVAHREVEFRTSSPGGVKWLLDRGGAIGAGGQADGDARRTAGTILDITARKELEERQQLLIAELDHRVKNVMANVSAMARLSGRRAQSVDCFVKTLDGRLKSMAGVHALLSRRDWDCADLHELADMVLSPFRSAVVSNVEMSGPELRLPPRFAQDLALVLHELATNAVKHGALSHPDGKVLLNWGTKDGMATIVWKERDGPAVAAPTHRGLGLSLIEGALVDAGCSVSCRFEPTGLVWSMDGPFMDRGAPRHVRDFARHDARRTTRPASPARKSKLRILVVEDEPLLAMQLQADLEQAGHTVLGPAMSLATGLAIARECKVDAAVLDVTLGRETSAEIASVLIARSIPVAFTTGYTDVDMIPETLRGVPRLEKPVGVADILDVLEGLAAPAAATATLPA